jgi:two-component system response regulator DesR
MIRILLAEDQGMVRDALARLLDLEPDFTVVAQVARGDEVVPRALESTPDIALLDVEMPGGNGLDAAAQLRAALPACFVLILTTFGRPGYLRRAMDAGASGFMVKDGPIDELAAAIRKVVAGENSIDAALAATALTSGTSPLSRGEHDVLAAAADGSTITEIAAQLHLSAGTVRNYLSIAITKTGTRNRLEAINLATIRGWL